MAKLEWPNTVMRPTRHPTSPSFHNFELGHCGSEISTLGVILGQHRFPSLIASIFRVARLSAAAIVAQATRLLTTRDPSPYEMSVSAAQGSPSDVRFLSLP